MNNRYQFYFILILKRIVAHEKLTILVNQGIIDLCKHKNLIQKG